MHKRNITLKECAATATTNSEETRNLGIALTINSMQVECARIAILTVTIVRGGNKKMRRRMIRWNAPVN
jgi:hypothetical protein